MSLRRRLERLEDGAEGAAVAEVSAIWGALTDEELALYAASLHGAHLAPQQREAVGALQARLRTALSEELLASAVRPWGCRGDSEVDAAVRQVTQSAVPEWRRRRVRPLVADLMEGGA